MFMERLESSLDAVAGRKVILVTHVVQVPEFTVSPSNDTWKYFNAFLGSPECETLCTVQVISPTVHALEFDKPPIKK